MIKLGGPVRVAVVHAGYLGAVVRKHRRPEVVLRVEQAFVYGLKSLNDGIRPRWSYHAQRHAVSVTG